MYLKLFLKSSKVMAIGSQFYFVVYFIFAIKKKKNFLLSYVAHEELLSQSWEASAVSRHGTEGNAMFSRGPPLDECHSHSGYHLRAAV